MYIHNYNIHNYLIIKLYKNTSKRMYKRMYKNCDIFHTIEDTIKHIA